MIDQAVIEGPGIDPEFRDFGDIADDDLFFVGSTTGTTGLPRLVAETQRGFFTRRNSEDERNPSAIVLPGLRRERFGVGDRLLATVGDTSKYGFGLALRLLGLASL